MLHILLILFGPIFSFHLTSYQYTYVQYMYKLYRQINIHYIVGSNVSIRSRYRRYVYVLCMYNWLFPHDLKINLNLDPHLVHTALTGTQFARQFSPRFWKIFRSKTFTLLPNYISGSEALSFFWGLFSTITRPEREGKFHDLFSSAEPSLQR